MRQARLCFVAESGVDVRLVEGLASRFNLNILARRIPGGVEISQAPKIPVATSVGPSSRFGFAWNVLSGLGRRRGEVDFIIVQGYGVAAFAANLAGRIWNIPTVMLVCSPAEKYYLCRRTANDSDKPFRWRELWAIKVFARVNSLIGQQYLVLSRHLADVVRSHGTRKAVTVLPLYGVDTEIFSHSQEPKSALRKRLHLPEEGALILFSSRLAPEKDAETLLAAIRQLLDAGRELWLVNASRGYESFARFAREAGVEHRVIAMDAVHPLLQLPDLYRASDVCVQASREEGLGFSPLEALACGIPVVAASVGGLQETIVDGQTGWAYEVGDPVVLAACIADVLNHPVEAERRTRAGKALVCAGFEQQLVFDQLERILMPQLRIESTGRQLERCEELAKINREAAPSQGSLIPGDGPRA